MHDGYELWNDYFRRNKGAIDPREGGYSLSELEDNEPPCPVWTRRAAEFIGGPRDGAQIRIKQTQTVPMVLTHIQAGIRGYAIHIYLYNTTLTGFHPRKLIYGYQGTDYRSTNPENPFT